jgi:hypothetical protein
MPTTDWASRMAALEERLRPLAEGPPPVPIGEPDWERKMRAATPAVDRAGVRDECEALLGELVNAYDGGDDATRAAIRQLFRDHHSFAWAAALPVDAATPTGFRAELIHFSMLDQGRDPRDAQLWLDDLVATARAAGTPTRQALEDVARLSRQRRVYDKWSSTEGMLLNAR